MMKESNETQSVRSLSAGMEKQKKLWQDDRSYRKRFIFALIVLFAVCFTFLFFGPMEITAYGQSSLVFNFDTGLPVMAAFAVGVCIVGALVLAIFRGRIFDYILTAVFSLLLCGYIQGNFLNGKQVGALMGDSIQWSAQKTSMTLNLLIWLLVFLVPFFVLYFSKKVWKKTLIYISAALVVMQGVAFVTMFTSGTVSAGSNKSHYLSTKDESVYSSKHNTLVFLLDRLDYDNIEEIKREEPHFFDRLDGFTSYDNAISNHCRTIPAINYLFTNCDSLLWKVPQEQYLEQSWDYGGKNILKDIKVNNYTLDFYTDINCMFASGDTVQNYVSNLPKSVDNLSRKSLVRNLCNLSGYRYLPVALKPFFWCYSDDVNNNIFKSNNMYKIDETQYDKIGGFSKTDSTNYFKYYHFMGSHNPYTVNVNGIRTGSTDVISQTKGNFQILYRAFAKMKKLGVYDNSTIIILGDHGDIGDNYQPLAKATRIGFFYKPAGREGTPLKASKAPISFINMPATFAKSAGVKDYHKYGKPIDEVGENDQVTRYYHRALYGYYSGARHEKYLLTYQIDGDAALFKNWKLKNSEVIKQNCWYA